MQRGTCLSFEVECLANERSAASRLLASSSTASTWLGLVAAFAFRHRSNVLKVGVMRTYKWMCACVCVSALAACWLHMFCTVCGLFRPLA